ncbi:acyltransferase [Carnobacteriaceae bacterium zg-C25]|nr:acyltransferase [Carnobacteriaceae bacterium zg-C25]
MRKHNAKIDFIKAISIVFVILLHCFSVETRNKIGAPFHMLQAVPLFMLVSGYNFSMSISSKNQKVLEYYRFSNLWRKLSKIVIPFTVVYIIQMIILAKDGYKSLGEYILLFINGGFGPGGYYIVMMVQVIMVMPILYYSIKKFPYRTLVSLFIVSVVFEYYAYTLSDFLYRLLLLRYVFVLALGVYYALHKKTKKIYWGILALFSLVYITKVEYTSFRSFTNLSWRSQNIYAYFYPFVLFMGMLSDRYQLSHFTQKVTQKIGQASYYIYVIQMMYFFILNNKYKNMLGASSGAMGKLFYALFSVSVCCLLGLLWMKLHQKWTEKRLNK